MAKPLKAVIDAYDLCDAVIGNKGEMLDFVNFTLEIDGLVDKFDKVPDNIQWTTMQRTLVHFKAKVSHLVAFEQYVKRSFPCKPQKLGTYQETWTFDAASCTLALMACN